MDGYNNYYSPAPAGFRSFVTVKNVLKVLSGLCILFYFIPVFFVSCAGQKIYVSGVKASFGLGDLDAYPLTIFLLLFEIALLVMLFLKNIPVMTAKIANLGLSVCDFIGWIIFYFFVKDKAEGSGAGFGTTAAYPITIILLILELVITILVMLNVFQNETNLIDFFTSDKMKNAVNTGLDKVSSAVNTASDGVASMFNSKPNGVVLGYCQTCGKPITLGNKFCMGCGTAVSPELLAKGEEIAAQMAEQARIAEQERIAAEQARIAEERARMAAQNVPAAPAPQAEVPVAETPVATATVEVPVAQAPVEAPAEPQAEDTIICKACGSTLKPGMAFCNICGTKQE